VNVEGNIPATVNLRFDGVLDAGTDFVALNFKSEADRAASEIAYASVIGRALQARRVVTLGLEVDARTGLPRLVGRVIDPNREAQVSSHTTTVAAGMAPPFGVAKDLGNRLRLKQETNEPQQVQEPIEAARPAAVPANPAANVTRQPVPSSPRRLLPAWPGWVVAGLAAGGIALGAAFLAVDGQQSCEYPSTVPGGVQCPKVFDTRSQGIAYTTLGVAFLAAGITWGVVNTVKKRH
jgi:hypothetical protein